MPVENCKPTAQHFYSFNTYIHYTYTEFSINRHTSCYNLPHFLNQPVQSPNCSSISAMVINSVLSLIKSQQKLLRRSSYTDNDATTTMHVKWLSKNWSSNLLISNMQFLMINIQLCTTVSCQVSACIWTYREYGVHTAAWVITLSGQWALGSRQASGRDHNIHVPKVCNGIFESWRWL